MDERIHKREMEYAAKVKKGDFHIESKEELAGMDVDDNAPDQQTNLLGTDGKAKQVSVQDQFCIDDEQMIKVEEQKFEPGETKNTEDLMIL